MLDLQVRLEEDQVMNIWWHFRNPWHVYDNFVVHKSFKLSRLRHDEPFAKRRAGKLRRAARHFRLEDKRSYVSC